MVAEQTFPLVMIQHHPDRLASLVRELARLPNETEWLEFKRNNEKPEAIGEYISALSNSAALADKAHGYLVWGWRTILTR